MQTYASVQDPQISNIFNIFLINSNPHFFRGHLATDWMSLIGASLEEQLKKLYLLL